MIDQQWILITKILFFLSFTRVVGYGWVAKEGKLRDHNKPSKALVAASAVQCDVPCEGSNKP